MMDIFEISRESIISDVLAAYPEAMPVFQDIGMHCLGCALATSESMEAACAAHGVDPDEFIINLKAYLMGI